MKLRIGSVAFLLGSVATAVTWLTLQPALVRIIEAVHKHAPGSPAFDVLTRVRGLLPYYLALDLVLVTALCYLVLHLAVGRPLERTEQAIEQLAHFDSSPLLRPSGGPLLSRLQRSLKRMADALIAEQAITRRQLDELRAAHEKLSRAQMELIAAERLATVGRLAAGVAHEVGNPLAGILGYLSVVRMRASREPEVADLLSRIDGEIQRIDQIVRGLLDLGRPSRGNPGPIDVAAVADASARLLAAAPDLKGVQIRLDVPKGTIARAEQGPLSQVLMNLILNASQAMGGKGQVTVRARVQEGRVVLDVEDEGPGIAPEVLPRLFEPFFTTKEAGKGTGLGLAVSKHLATTMGGELFAANREGIGARFTLVLPAA